MYLEGLYVPKLLFFICRLSNPDFDFIKIEIEHAMPGMSTLPTSKSMPDTSLAQTLGGPFAQVCKFDEDVLHKCLRGSYSSRSPSFTSSKALRFIHVTKCAGSSVESVSQKRWGKHDMDYCSATAEIYTERVLGGMCPSA